MKVCEIHQSFGLQNLKFVERPDPKPSRTQILMRVKAASLNYRDLMMIRGEYNPKLKLPLVPVSDGIGEIVAIGEDVKRVKIGDRVAGVLAQSWFSGKPNKELYKHMLGGPIDGMLAEQVVFDEQGVVKIPDYLSDVEAATLPCAALTAWRALTDFNAVQKNDWVVVQGTGGVALFALQFAKYLGARVIITSSSSAKLQKALALGADAAINYKEHPDWSKKVLEITDGVGAEHIVELGGGGTLEESLAAAKVGGQVSVVGAIAGANSIVDVRKILMKTIRVQGVFIGNRDTFESMNEMLEKARIKPMVDKVFPFSEAVQAFHYFESQQHMGKVCIEFGTFKDGL